MMFIKRYIVNKEKGDEMLQRKEFGSGIDSFDLLTIQEYNKTGYKLKDILEDCKKHDIKIVFQNKTVEPDWMMEIYLLIMQRSHDELKIEQRAGIERALKRKAEGQGACGRPRTLLPSDFEQELKKRIDNKESLSSYCQELHMKKSTFYKWAKIYQNSWKQKKDKNECVYKRISEMDLYQEGFIR